MINFYNFRMKFLHYVKKKLYETFEEMFRILRDVLLKLREKFRKI